MKENKIQYLSYLCCFITSYIFREQPCKQWADGYAMKIIDISIEVISNIQSGN